MRMIATAIVALLLSSAAMAQEAPNTRCLQAHYQPDWGVVQVFSQEIGQTNVGTGICVARMQDGRRLFLTADHVAQGDVINIRTDGLDAEARVVARHENNDVALLEADVPTDHPLGTVILAQNAPQGTVPWDGFSPDSGQYRRYEGETQPVPGTMAHVWSRGRLRDGMSGGPVLNQNREVAGMIVAKGTRNDWGLAVTSEWIRNWMALELEGEYLHTIAARHKLRSVPENFQLVGRRVNPSEWTPVAWKTSAPPSIFR